MILTCESPQCTKTHKTALSDYILMAWRGKGWCCPEHTERLNPTNKKYDDHDPNTNPDLNKYHD